MSTCASCGVSGQPDTARFCADCGASLLVAPACGTCQAELLPGARFCSTCGAVQSPAAAATAPVQPVASRRVTSVLFGDLVGFTSLSETRDQEDVRELLSRYFEECSQIVGRYGGTVEKFIGDAVMAVWGVPTAHEDDAERAVRAGLELVNRITAMGTDLAVPDLAMRVGIVTGEVAVTVGALQQGMVAGDAVNTAARVQSAATPGQVWVDETTRLLTTSAISYVDVGSHTMKGKADPVPLWAVRAVVAGIGGGQRADGLEAPHTGRDRDLRLVKEIFHGVEETGRPAMLVVSGEPGVGKTRLSWEFSKYTDGLSGGVYWHSGRCLSYGEGVAFYALAEAVRGRLQALRPETAEMGDTDEDQARMLSHGLETLVSDPDERAWLEPRMGALLGIGAVGTFKREDLFNAWATFFHRVRSDDDPVAIVIDDAHHADDGLMAFLEHLMAVATFPLFVLVLARPGLLDERSGLAANRRVTVLHLEPLSEHDMGGLLDGLVVGLPDRVRASLVNRAEGIPLFAVETVRSLIDRDLVLPRGGQYVLSDRDGFDLDGVAAPASLQALIAARLDALAPDERRVINRASVIGDSFSRQAIGGLCADVDDLDDALAGLVRLQILRRESDRLSAEVGQYRFVQSSVRQVAYGTLARRDRKTAHLAVVDLLERGDNSAGEVSPIIAQHLLEALDAMPDAEDHEALATLAVDHLRRAATRASALGVPAEAAGHLYAAFTRCADPDLAAHLESELADQLSRSGAHERAMEHAVHARDHFDATGDAVNAALASASYVRSLIWGAGELDRAAEVVRERLASLDGLEGAPRVELLLSALQVSALLRTGADVREAAERHARMAEAVGDDSEIADSYVSLALYYMVSGPRGLGRVLLESAAERARTARDHGLLTRGLANLNAAWTQDDALRAADYGRESLIAARLLGDSRWLSASTLNLALALFVAGEWEEALERVDEDILEASDSHFAELIRCRIAEARGEPWSLSVADEAVDEDLALASFRLALQTKKGLEAGHDVAGRLADAARLSFRQGGLFDDFALLWQTLADAAWQHGARDALDDLFTVPEQDKVNKRPTGLRAAEARIRGLLAIEDDLAPEVVEDHFRTAIAEAQRWNSAPTLARCRADLGTWLVGQGRAGEAVELLAQARATYEELRAHAWIRELDEQLVGVPVGAPQED